MIDEVVFLRHGRTAFNVARRLQGQIDVPLDIIGQWQADQSASELARRYYWAKVANIARHPDTLAQPGPGAAKSSDIEEYRQVPASSRRMVVVSSDLFRALQTAHAFADMLGLDVTADARLRERSFGQWEGMTRDEIRAEHADAYDSWRVHTGGELAFGVESRTATGLRGADAVLDLVRGINAEHADEPTTLMLVGHGSWHVATIETLLGMDPDNLSNLDWHAQRVLVDAQTGIPAFGRRRMDDDGIQPGAGGRCSVRLGERPAVPARPAHADVEADRGVRPAAGPAVADLQVVA